MQASASNEKEYTLQVLSGVIFAPLVKKPDMKTVIQASVWSPTNHLLYPDTFRKACEQILLCSQFASKNANVGSSSESGKPTNAASLLPRAMWIEVLKFCSRDCKIMFLPVECLVVSTWNDGIVVRFLTGCFLALLCSSALSFRVRATAQ